METYDERGTYRRRPMNVLAIFPLHCNVLSATNFAILHDYAVKIDDVRANDKVLCSGHDERRQSLLPSERIHSAVDYRMAEVTTETVQAVPYFRHVVVPGSSFEVNFVSGDASRMIGRQLTSQTHSTCSCVNSKLTKFLLSALPAMGDVRPVAS